ncbi:MAG: multicopper oxidase domain-containing protein [Bacteroidota bacterium]
MKPFSTLLVAATAISFFSNAQALLSPKTQPQFVNPLPIPSVIDARNGGVFSVDITQFKQHLGLIDPVTKQPLLTTVWGYNGTYPGPTILAKRNVPVSVFWHNKLVDASNKPLKHLLPVDESIHWALQHHDKSYGIPIVTHLHGGHTESASDGLPEAWYTPGFALRGMNFVKGEAEPYFYDNDQEAATLWYHDHALGITRLNVYAGLAGYYLLTDNNEAGLQSANKLPAAPYDLGLAIQDRMFTANGELFYPSEPEVEEEEEEGGPTPGVLPEFFGDFILVNGATWPVLEVEPRQYRFRILNGSDSRFYNMSLSSGGRIIQIGSDNGLLPAPFPVAQMLIGPGERKDVIIDFSDMAFQGQTIILKNNAKTPFPKGSAVNSKTTGQIMAFKVTKALNANYPLTSLPAVLREPINRLQTNLPARKLILFEAEDEYGRLKPMLGTVENGVMEWTDDITENPMKNDTEIWEIYNETMDAHPIHLHMVTMQLLNRQKFSAEVNMETGKPSKIRLIGKATPPAADEAGWKDTYVMMPGEVTRVMANFDKDGLYVWHCHILSHEDHEMMRPYFVGNKEPLITRKANKHIIGKINENDLQLRAIPNPFSNILKVQFNVPNAVAVRLSLYDSKGSLVQKIFSGQTQGGLLQYSINGSRWSNGIYYLELVVNEQKFMRKLVLEK